MANEFRMPSLGPDMESGTLVEWRVKPGDAVKRGDIVALIETDKGVIDVEIFADGTIEKLLVSQGAHVPVGTVLAQLNGAGEASAPSTSPPAPAKAAPAVTAAKPEPVEMVARADADHEHRYKASPAARARARELGVDLSKVVGTGLGHAITIDDVIKAAAPAPRAAPEPAHDMRQVIARAMSRSKREIPHYYLSLTCTFAPAHAYLEAHNAAASIEERLLPSALMLKAVAIAAKVTPGFNGFYKEDQFEPAADVHVGMAIAMRGGRLVAPAIFNADDKPLATIMNELRDVTTRVRAGHMRSSELAMPTITLTALAEEGVDVVTPVINPPQVAIVGIGSVVERPWVVGGVVQPTKLVTITLAADHRVTDGRAGAKFLACIRDALQTPEKL
jgi:pyruvate dehydrogenase E2 component (dihydrolipoamide acetyltransferase)